MKNFRPFRWINFGDQPEIRFADRKIYPFGPFCRDMEGSRFGFEVWNITGVIGDKVEALMHPGAEPMFYIYPETVQMTQIPFLTDGSRYAWVFIEDEDLLLEDRPHYWDEEDHRMIVAAINRYLSTHLST